MKTILIPATRGETTRPALETALLLARRFDSYMEGFALRWSFSAFAGIEAAGVVPVEAFQREDEEEEKRARELFEGFMQSQGVPRGDGSKGALSYGWIENAPEGDSFAGSLGRVFDVIVMARPEATASGLHHRAIESALFESGRPLLLAPPKAPGEIATNVLVHWNSSTEQARATALALPLLERAERVTVLTVIGGNAVPGPSAEQMIRYLRRNGVKAEPMTVELEGKTTGEAVLKAADKTGSNLLIKGAYTQSRLRQVVFGGPTRHIIENANLPVLLAH
ncbi:MAG: universal stress protein [Bradyrhizobiaceae bacterium]|nr:universal stress protein [Bradyrhizobiaceae bacterium]